MKANVAEELEALPQEIPEELKDSERLRTKGELDEALRICVTFLNDNFDHVPAITLAAHILMDAKRMGLAAPLISRAMQLSKDSSMLWNNLGHCYQETGKFSEAEACFFRAMKIGGGDQALLNNNISLLYINLAQPHLSLKYAEKALEADPAMQEAKFNHALALLQLGRWREGWQEYNVTLGYNKDRKERVYGPVPRWAGVEGKTIIAHGEQGIGDEIYFASCIPDLMRKNKVIIECNKRLEGLFRRSFGVETHGTLKDDVIRWPYERGMLRKFDASIAFGSLPGFYRNEESECPGTPYLVADPQRRVQWRALLDSLGPKMKVGIAWTGGLKRTGSARRSLELEDLLPILRQDAQFVSLQYKDAPEIDKLKDELGIQVHHWKHAVQTDDYDDTAALVAELDMVISVTTAVIHLCGALGKTCWVLTPKTPIWRYGLTGEKMQWYDSIRLCRQKTSWLDLINEVAVDLRTLIGKR